jgi:hypothetical protein
MHNEPIKKLRQIAHEFNCQLSIEAVQDDSYVDCVLQKDDIDLDVIFPRHNGEYYAYGIESTGLPREIYLDDPKDFTEKDRSNEILETIEKILAKKIKFHEKPGIFNKEKGYIILPIDGKETKIPQKKNYFRLPVA